MAIINLSTGNVLFLQQNEKNPSNNPSHVASTKLFITQIVRCSKQLINVNQITSVGQSFLTVHTHNISVQNTLSLRQLFARTKYIEVYNSLVIAQKGAKGPIIPPVLNGLTISHLVKASRARLQTLTLAHTVALRKTSNRALTHSLTIVSGVARFITDQLRGCTSPAAVDPVPVVLIKGADSLTLTVPELGDSDKIEVARVQENTRGGDLIIFGDPVWPKTEILTLRFVNLPRVRALRLLEFMNNYIGQNITLIDHQSISWLGIILNPETPITCLRDDSCGDYEVELQFQGDRV